MALSTSPASPEPEPFALAALSRFYRWNAPLYDWTRPFILFGRGEIVRRLGVGAGHRVLDVGCGTGWSFRRLLAAGGRVTGVEPSSSMRRRAERRAARLAGGDRITFEAEPFGGDDRHGGAADRVLFSYSLSMIPPARSVLQAARASLRDGGAIGVVDFLDARPGMREWLTASHVHLGPERLRLLRELFPAHDCETRSVGAWRYFLFVGRP